MTTDTEKLQQLVAENKIERALHILGAEIAAYPGLKNQLFTIQAKFNDIRTKENMGMLGNADAFSLKAQVNYSLLELLKEMEKPVETHNAVEEKSRLNTVFISYNHNDMAIANRLQAQLKKAGIQVLIDNEKMKVGEDIKSFIEESVRNSASTVSIVSRASLLSAWVAMESVNTFYQEKSSSGKKFIACYIEDDFFNRNFTDDALDHIEKEIAQIQQLITTRLQKNRSIRDLQNELTRLTDLRNNLDEIVRRLRESLCIDIREQNLETNFNKITEAINS